jgi:hypothetical protein
MGNDNTGNATQSLDRGKNTPAEPRRVSSRDLLEGRSELVIVHQGREYRLRLTQNDKLILTA